MRRMLYGLSKVEPPRGWLRRRIECPLWAVSGHSRKSAFGDKRTFIRQAKDPDLIFVRVNMPSVSKNSRFLIYVNEK